VRGLSLPNLLKKSLPALLGIVLAAIPFALFEFWLEGQIERQARADVEFNAQRAIAVIEGRIDRVLAALDELVAGGATSCASAHLDAMRAASFATWPIKELSVLGIDGQTSCSDMGLPLAAREPRSKPQPIEAPDTSIELVRFPIGDQDMVRVRRTLPNGDSLAGAMSVDLFVPIAWSQTNMSNAYARVALRDGTNVVEVNAQTIENTLPDDIFSASQDSERFGLRAVVSRTRAQLLARNSDLHVNGLILSGLAAIIIFGVIIALTHRRRSDPREKLAAALAAGEFVPFYQPIIDITSGRLIGAEALARWRKPDGSIVSPAMFIPMMEENGLIVELSERMMRRACEDVGEAYTRHPHLRVSFNLTAEQFEHEATVDEIRSIFYRSPIKLSQVVLELTERQEPRDFDQTRQIVASLQVLGCKVALDDVGTGHSGLSSILKLGVDVIKIDKMFVDSMDNDRNSAAIIGTLVELARKLGMDTVAEGVEHFDQVAELRRRGIRAAQGFVFSPPLPAASYVQLIDALTSSGEAALPAAEALQEVA
jgi:sensor c-di-GMP phosphodiesterase-like protein